MIGTWAAFGRLVMPGFELTANAGPPGMRGVPPGLEAELRDHGSTPEGLRELSRFADMDGTDPDRVIQGLLAELERGRVDVSLRRAPIALCGPALEREVPLADLAVVEAIQTSYAVELQLLDQDDVPVAGAAYRLLLPDGSVRSGVLDDRGLARVGGLDSAQPCAVSFPEFDEQSWSYVHARPL